MGARDMASQTGRCVSSACKTPEKPELHAGDLWVKPARSQTLRKLTDKGRSRSPRGRGAGSCFLVSLPGHTSSVLPSCASVCEMVMGVSIHLHVQTPPLLMGHSLKFIPASHLLWGVTTSHPEGANSRAVRGPTEPDARLHVGGPGLDSCFCTPILRQRPSRSGERGDPMHSQG